MSDSPKISGALRSGTVRYCVRLERRRGRYEVPYPVLTEEPEAIGRLVAMLLNSFDTTCEISLSIERACMYVFVPEDVTIEALDAKAAKVIDEWEATLS